MRLLLDTCTFLYIAQDEGRLSSIARSVYQNPDNDCFLSVASAWEIAIKCSNGRLTLSRPPSVFVPQARITSRTESLPIDEESALQVARLPMLHGDPFDRILVAQAIVHGLTILTPDPLITNYPARTLW